ncbi:uncharacterized protein F4807DRAFT_70597 [Annulohypoxylon truncatum]|uniref:uncharacterized protein n=1 Tax=Annulohypoxylon truncatum TaxID=327061 RepID=UPI00200804B3|nr:uncharacterized protein F4807DRAFT_70597 [Annulohypoxylon truncatum]KAI1210128.1 hypothetical protein F4807DRAFT_70597 [Annulohypoxylon truncatum]
MNPKQPTPPEPRKATPEICQVSRGDAVREKLSRNKKIKADQLGLHILHQPSDVEDIEVDVLAIHGIGATPEYTWVDRESGVSWLSDSTMLPDVLPNARIMVYNYESFWFGENAVRQSLSGVAEKLLMAFHDERSECPRRPIIFIGHCFGGLVSLQCYMTATIHKGTYPDISNCVAGMTFLGTPFHGIHSDSGMATMGEVYSAIVESKVQRQDNVMNTIAQDNDVLVNAVSEFSRLLESSPNLIKPKIFCFYEQKASHIGRVAGLSGIEPKFLVTESSGTLLGHGKEGLPLDHFSMNKFVSKTDNNFKSVRRQILEMNKNAMELIEVLRSASPEKTRYAPLSSSPKHTMPSRAGPILKEENFAKRKDILKVIEQKLLGAPYVALYGDSGNGKTHVAVEYAYKFIQDTCGQVHWVNAGSAAEFELSYKHIAETLHINRASMKNDDILKAVYENLSQDRNGRWLMVLDGWDDETTLKATSASHPRKSLLDYIPKTGLVTVLATTRSKKIAMRIVASNSQSIIEVPKLKEADASLLLLGKETSDLSRRRRAAIRAKELGGSAGTLVLAHLYQKKTSVDSKTYMGMINDPQAKDTSKTMRAWRLLYELMRDKYPEEADLLFVMGSMNVQCIPNSFFERVELFTQIPHLVDYGMVEPSADRKVTIITSTIRECVQKCLDEKGEREMVEERVISTMCNKFHGDEHRAAEVLLPCALMALKFQPTSADIKLKLANLHSEVAKLYGHMEQGQLAADHWKRALSIYEEDSKDNQKLIQDTKEALKAASERLKSTESHTKTIEKTGNNVSQVAEKKELLMREKNAGKHDKDTIRKASEIATSQLIHGETSEAKASIELFERILEWCKENKGDQSIDVGRMQYNLALALERQGEYDRAEQLYQSSLRIARSHLGPYSPETLRPLSNLASMYSKQGRLEDSEQTFRATFLGQQKSLGADHPDTLRTRHDIAMMLGEKGQIDAAVGELEDVLSKQLQLLGRDNPATLRTARGLAVSYCMQGSPEKIQKSENFLRETLKIQSRVLGKTHPDTSLTKLNLKELLDQVENSKA